MILEKTPSHLRMEETLRRAGYAPLGSPAQADGSRRGWEEFPRALVVQGWQNSRTGDVVFITMRGAGMYYSWELYLPVGGNDVEGTVVAFSGHLDLLKEERSAKEAGGTLPHAPPPPAGYGLTDEFGIEDAFVASLRRGMSVKHGDSQGDKG